MGRDNVQGADVTSCDNDNCEAAYCSQCRIEGFYLDADYPDEVCFSCVNVAWTLLKSIAGKERRLRVESETDCKAKDLEMKRLSQEIEKLRIEIDQLRSISN